MDNELLTRVDEQSRKLDAIYVSVEKTRKYFFWTLVINIVVVILPLVGLLFIIPSFLDTLNIYNSLGL